MKDGLLVVGVCGVGCGKGKEEIRRREKGGKRQKNFRYEVDSSFKNFQK